jgi:hypothetical protein
MLVKDEYWTFEERVRFFYFIAPQGAFKATINMTGLTEDFYPTVLVYKNALTSTPSDVRTL